MIEYFIPTNWTIAGLVVFGAMAITRMIMMFSFGYTAIHKSKGTKWEKPVKFTLIPLFAFGYVYDVFLNYTVATVMFWEKPQEKTISERMSRYLKDDYSWRFKLSAFFCKILHQFDPGHCSKPHSPAALFKK